MEWAAAVAALLGVVGILLKMYIANAPYRAMEKTYDEIEKGRQDIANGDSDAVSSRIDKLLTQERDITGKPSSVVTGERIGTLLGMVNRGRSTSGDS